MLRYLTAGESHGKGLVVIIEGLPAGKHSFNVWHERASGSGQMLERKLQITIEVDKDNRLQPGDIRRQEIARPLVGQEGQ